MVRRVVVILAVVATLIGFVPAVAGVVLNEPFEEEEWWLAETDEEGNPLEPQLWLDFRTSDDDRSAIIEAYRADGLGVTIPPGGRRGQGALWLLPDNVEEAWFRYHLNLDDWAAIDSGKLPGFADIGSKAGLPQTALGCNPSTVENPGWSARVLFNEPGTEGAEGTDIRLGYYTYHLDQPGSCGEFMHWNDAGILEQRRWYCIEGHVAMNTPGANDGVLEAWVDEQKVFSRSDLAFRRPGEEWVEVNTFWLNIYFGGSTVANDTDLDLRFDELVISDSGRIPCLTRFTDDDGNIFEGDIEFLFDEGIVAGCAQNLYCPGRTLSRAELVAFLERWLEPPATTVDYFDDDTGHWAEGVLNRMAGAGVLRGCGERLACPDVPVTRSQVAAFLRRTFEVPIVQEDFFTDDDGSIFEGDINAIAAVGITFGCSPDIFCPDRSSRRDETAALIARAVKWAAAL